MRKCASSSHCDKGEGRKAEGKKRRKMITYGRSRSANAGSIEGSVAFDCDELVLDELLLLRVVVVELPLLPVDDTVPLRALVVTTTVP